MNIENLKKLLLKKREELLKLWKKSEKNIMERQFTEGEIFTIDNVFNLIEEWEKSENERNTKTSNKK